MEKTRKNIDTAADNVESVMRNWNTMYMNKENMEMRLKVIEQIEEEIMPNKSVLQCLKNAKPQSMEFVEALKKIHTQMAEVKKKQKHILMMESAEKLKKYADEAHEKMFKWAMENINTQVQNRQSDENTNKKDQVIVAMQMLKHTTYLKPIVEQMALVRKMDVMHRFQIALMKGTPPHMKPIELVTHDPVRYVSEMLAWIEQTLTDEKDSIDALLASTDAPVDDRASVETTSEPSIIEKASMDLISMIADGVGRTLKTRIDHVLNSRISTEIAFRIWNLLVFYSLHMQRLVNDDCVLQNVLRAVTLSAYEVVMRSIESLFKSLNAAPTPALSDLSPSMDVNQIVRLLLSLCEIWRTTIVTNDDKEAAFQPFADAIMIPLSETLRLSSKGLSPEESVMFEINVMHYIIVAIRRYDFLKTRLQQIDSHVKQLIDNLAELSTRSVLQKSGLLALLEHIRSYKEQQQCRSDQPPLAELSETSVHAVTQALHTFHIAISRSGSLLIPHCDQILNPLVRRVAHKAIALHVSDAYRLLFETITDPANGYKGAVLLRHQPREIDALFEVDRTVT